MTDASDPFAGLDQVRWGRMRHAYGPATELPELLRGLVDPDPAVREAALGAMYGGVHHQGDVYTCTVAAIPFLLRIAAHPELPGRAEVVRLLASIGYADDPTGLTGRYREANEAVAAAYPLWERLLAEPDPRLREAVANVLPACTDRAAQALARLLDRFATEHDPGVRAAIVRVAAALAGRGEGTAQVRRWLSELLSGDPDPRLRLVALAEFATLPAEAEPGPPAETVPAPAETGAGASPADPPTAGVGDALDLLATVYETGTPGVGHESVPPAADLVRAVSVSYGDRVDERLRLLTALLAAPNPECRRDALYPAGNLVDGWRGRYDELIALVGAQLRDGDPGLRQRAVQVLEHLGPLAVPAADALAAVLADADRAAPASTDGRLSWVIEWGSGLPTVGPALRALAGAGDPRALPMLGWALDRDEMPRDVGYLLAGFGPRAAPLVPLLRRRLADLPAPEPGDDRRDSLVTALARIGPAAADALPELLALPAGPAVLRALAATGADLDACRPILRTALASDDRRTALAAGAVLWQLAADRDAALTVANRYLGGDEFAVREAADVLAELGPAADVRAGRLRQLTRRRDRTGWLPLTAARALWRATRDPEPVLPVLDRVWQLNPHTRRSVAALWAELGPAAAGARDALTIELTRVRRHNAREGAYSTGQVRDDEELLELCRTALAALG